MAAQGIRHLPAPSIQAEAGGFLRSVAIPAVDALATDLLELMMKPHAGPYS